MFAHFISRHAPRLPLLLYRIAIGSSYKGGEGWKCPPPAPGSMLSWGGGWQDLCRVASQGSALSRGRKGVTQNILVSANLSQMKRLCLVYNISCVTGSCCILFCRGCPEPLAPQVSIRRSLLLKTAFFFFFPPLHRARLSQTISFGHDYTNKNFLPCFSSSSLQASHQTWAPSTEAFLLSKNI